MAETDCIALVVGAGRGQRFGGDLPKQYADLLGRPVMARAFDALGAHGGIDALCAVIHPDDRDRYDAAARASAAGARLLPPVFGGATRQESVLRGLEAIAPLRPKTVLIHDAARPLVTKDVIGRVLAALGETAGAVPALPVSDTLKRADDAGRIAETVPRAGLYRVQTPQAFRFDDIFAAHRTLAGGDFTDDAAVMEKAGGRVRLVAGDADNLKITSPEDLETARRVLGGGGGGEEIRTGFGFDVHRFGPGDHVMLLGVRVPFEFGLVGHSDADVGLHALTDALLGAAGAGDIGLHFPPSDPAWAGAASETFLADAARRVRAQGGRLVNVDVTLVCEAPKVGPHRDRMRERVAGILGIKPERVNVKATTTEGLGFTGRGEGIAAQAVATVAFASGGNMGV